jgi:hypothetical protein
METLFANLAGAIDSDGRMFIARAQGYRRRLDRRQVPYYIATIALSDSSRIVPDLLQATFPARRCSTMQESKAGGLAHVGSGRSGCARTSGSLIAVPQGQAAASGVSAHAHQSDRT